MNNINLEIRPRRVLSFFSFSLAVPHLSFTVSLFLSFIHVSFLISPLSVLLFIPSCSVLFLWFSCLFHPRVLLFYFCLLSCLSSLTSLSLCYILVLSFLILISLPPFSSLSLSFKCLRRLLPSSPMRPLKDNYSSSE